MANAIPYILDASVIVKWLNQDREQHARQALDILHRAAQGTAALITSDLAVHEVMNALIRGKGIEGRNLRLAVKTFFELPLDFFPTDERSCAAAALISEELQITFYDAIYMAIALESDAPLITANTKHQKSLGEIEVISLENWT